MTENNIQLLGRREQKKLALREKIIEESLNLIAIHGIDGMTIDAICDCADIAKKTFYNYYSSKHELIVDICTTELVGRSNYYIELSEQQYSSLTDKLNFIFDEMLKRLTDVSKTERELIDYMVGSLSENRAEGVGLLGYMNKTYHALFEQHQHDLANGYTAAFCAEMTVGMINSITLNWLNNEHHPINERFEMLKSYIPASFMLDPNAD